MAARRGVVSRERRDHRRGIAATKTEAAVAPALPSNRMDRGPWIARDVAVPVATRPHASDARWHRLYSRGAVLLRETQALDARVLARLRHARQYLARSRGRTSRRIDHFPQSELTIHTPDVRREL